ncbi:alpha/beta fold hydrolase [Conexibacter sp. W3-3-2]|uniref:alpha/beta fold hydrolase n=1 Tax=Conexibacter sp. W3-3-2 TaxID=2675227 RepID=UPI0013231211|nr:alpha/beta fold hydrolase [Conexibacter sp. W3-3-2]MTD44247.1 alpha/beta fold hydrolase [Conexibacter sp. W3-3-2]
MSATGIAYDRTGTGPPVVLLHGLGGERQVWDAVVEHLRAEREVVTVDLPGFGASAPLAQDVVPTPAAIAEQLARFLGEIGLERPHVAGNSLGGWIALELARRDVVASVTGLCPALWERPLPPKPFVMHRVARTLRPALPALMRTGLGRRAALLGIVARPGDVSPQDALRVASAYASAPAFAATNRAMRSGHFTGGERIRVPVLLAWGELDRLVTPPARALVPHAVSITLPGCSHLPMLDDPALSARTILRGSARTTG